MTSVIREHRVHVGWSIDPKDYKCPVGDAACVYDHVVQQLDAGNYGVILMHSIHSQTALALPLIIAEIRSRNMRFATVEEAVQARYGKSSAELVQSPSTCPLPVSATVTKGDE